MSINKNESLTIENQEDLFEVLSDECCEQLTGGKSWWKKVTKTFDHVVIKTLNNAGNDVVKVGGTSALGVYTAGELALEATGIVGKNQIDGN
ncbi:hypothetical protein NIES4075_53010 [Tolypothrix sp. NIES-4075]|uniref:hypothetical protein n=1 Tax=Tolypothrix sp. NIES-4075 TaxID=2005459 RepID=UPI000B5CE143|nr:hypothetical protein [Tolypothrix sp. NIES-4075]GAX44283.1 hypothetical protein NIES4075_53010 [Tolypothrix sp. NIES-4075]